MDGDIQSEPEEPSQATPVLEGELLAPEPPEEIKPAAAPDSSPNSDLEAAAVAYGATAVKEETLPPLLHLFAGMARPADSRDFNRLVVALAKSGLRQVVALSPNPLLEARLRQAGLPTVCLPFRRWFDFTTGPALDRLLADWPDALPLAWSPTALRALGRRQAMADRAAFAAVTAAEALDRLESADHLLSSSRHLIQSARLADWPGDYLHYLPPLVESRSDAPLARERLGSNPDRDVLLVVADLQPEARLDVAIRALAALPYCELWIAGEGAEQRRLALAARHCEVATRVFFLGEGVELPALYAAADLVLATADQDSHGLQILEAWAQSKPVVATKTAAARQLITDDFNGRLVPPGDAAALARLVDGVLHDASGYDRLIHEGKKAFDAAYRESQVIEAWCEFLRWSGGRVTEVVV